MWPDQNQLERRNAKTKMRIGTMNVRTVREKMDLIIGMMDSHWVDVMAIQETRLKRARTSGKTLGQATMLQPGNDEGGVCVLRSSQCSSTGEWERTPHRLRVCHATNAGQAMQLQHDLFLELTIMGE